MIESQAESQTEEEGGEDSQESAVSNNTSLVTEPDSDDDSEVPAANIEVLPPVFFLANVFIHLSYLLHNVMLLLIALHNCHFICTPINMSIFHASKGNICMT